MSFFSSTDPTLNTFLALKFVLKRNTEELKKLVNVQKRRLIYLLRNDLDDLEFYFAYLKKFSSIPDPGSYHYDNIDNMSTFDIYYIYDFFSAFIKCDTEKEYWDYCLEKGYVTEHNSDNESDED